MKLSPILFLIFACTSLFSQTTASYNLVELANNNGLSVEGRTWTVNSDPRNGLVVDEGRGEGFVWIKNLDFGEGVIELDIKGRDVQAKSFVGIAFHKVDARTYDVIYLRPFNFRSDDPVRKSHSIQYVSAPEFGWQRLREKRLTNTNRRLIRHRFRPTGCI